MKNPTFGIQIILFILLFLSCEKEHFEDAYPFPRKYVLDEYAFGKTEVFTNYQKEVNAKGREDFIGHLNFWDADIVQYCNAEAKRDPNQFQIHMYSDSSGCIICDGDTSLCTIIHENGILYFQSLLFNAIGFITPQNKLFGGLDDNPILKYHPLNVTYYPSTTGLSTTYYPCLYVMENNNKLIIPRLAYNYSLTKEYYRTMKYVSSINNMFNPLFLDKLNTTEHVDTIAYQNNKIILKAVH